MFMEVLMTVAWNIWKERNRFLFDGITPSILSWQERFKEDFAMLKHRTRSSLHPFIDSVIDNI